MQDVEHWWNGLWGTLARRDLFLRRSPDGWWEIEAREAGRSARGRFDTEDEAREILCTLFGGERYRRVDGLTRRSPVAGDGVEGGPQLGDLGAGGGQFDA